MELVRLSWSVPVSVIAGLTIVLVGLPIGGSATSNQEPNANGKAVEPKRFVAVTTAFVKPVDLSDFSISSAETPLVRPRAFQSAPAVAGLLLPATHLPPFVANHDTRNQGLIRGITDPRLPKRAKPSTLSAQFLSKVGADPWALNGVGFPNIETHSGDLKAEYKPFHALIDWQQTAGQGRWVPVPAVYCMGLSAQQIATRAAEHERQILEYAMRYGVSASLVKAVITKESCFDTKAISTAGAEGLMQLMPATARWLKVTDRADVNQNLDAGIRYLARLRKRFGSEELALAAYNAGPGNVERHGGIPPFRETQQYVVSVMAHYRRYVATSRFANERQYY